MEFLTFFCGRGFSLSAFEVLYGCGRRCIGAELVRDTDVDRLNGGYWVTIFRLNGLTGGEERGMFGVCAGAATAMSDCPDVVSLKAKFTSDDSVEVAIDSTLRW